MFAFQQTDFFESRRSPRYKLDVHRCINERNKLYKKWKSYTSAEDWDLFRIARNKVHVVAKNAKCECYGKEFNMLQLTSKNLWKKLHNIGLKKNRNECSIHPGIMNDFFHIPHRSSVHPSLLPTITFSSFNTFSDSEVYNSIMSIKSNVVGPDGIHLKFVKIHFDIYCSYFNHIVTTASFPQKWKIANIIPVVKKTSPSDPADYRLVSILSALSKAFERLICNQIVTHMRNNKHLSENQ